MSVDPRALAPARFIQSDDPAIIKFAREAAAGGSSKLDIALRLYYAVRDKIIYDPYELFKAPESYSAAHILKKGSGFCIPKAALLAACARVMGIPARIGFADVKNHLATPKLLKVNGSDIFRWHAFAEIMAEDAWVKATPAFNLSLCEKFGVHPLDWDGRTDSVFHPFDKMDRRHMEYVGDHGSFFDVPFEEISETYRIHNPGLMTDDPWGRGADFAAEAKPQ